MTSTGPATARSASAGGRLPSRPSAPASPWSSLRGWRWPSALLALPDRLLLVLLWTCLAVAVCTVTGAHRRSVLIPAVLLTVAVTWRYWRPAEQPRRRYDLAAVAACLLLVAVWVGLQLPLTGERVVVTRDPDNYTLTALWLVEQRSPAIPVTEGSESSQGFGVQDGSLRPWGNHLVPAMSAPFGWIWGTSGVLAANLVWGGFGLVGLFALARRIVGPVWALLPPAALALSLPMVAFSRSMYSEPLSLALTMLAGCWLLDGWRSDRARDFVLAGLALGGVSLTRIDGMLASVGVIAALTPLALLVLGSAAGTRRWSSPLVAAGAVPLIALGLLDVYRYSGTYLADHASQLTALVAVTALVVLFSGAVAARPLWGRAVHWHLPVRRAAPVLGGAMLSLWVVLATRPWWLTARGGTENGLVAALQRSAGLPVDGLRRYGEDSITWMTWYIGTVPVVLGLGALVAWVVVGLSDRRHGQLACLLALILPSTLLYFVTPQIFPDHVWASRRYLPVVLPGLLLATAWALRSVAVAPWRGRRARRLVAGVLALATVAWPASTLPGLWSVRDKGGLLAGVEQVCELIRGRPTVVTDPDSLMPTIAVVCGVPVHGIVESHPTPDRLRAAHRALGGGDVVLVTRGPTGFRWREVGPPPIPLRYEEWRATLVERPSERAVRELAVTVASLDARGRLGQPG